MGTPGYENTVKDDAFTGTVGIVRKEYEKIRRIRSERLFINSMSDTFHVAVSDDDIHGLFDAMAANASGTNFLICTKRAARLANMASTLPITSNMWMGVTVGCQKSLHRLDHLRKVPATIRWVSVEPMLEPLDLTPWLSDGTLQWVVVGGESKKGFRPMQREWAQAILDQCRQYGVPFFLKQWSAFNPKTDVEYPPTLEGQVWHEFPVLAAKSIFPAPSVVAAPEPTPEDENDPADDILEACRLIEAGCDVPKDLLPVFEVPSSFLGDVPAIAVPHPVDTEKQVRVPTCLADTHWTSSHFPKTKHVFWFEHASLMSVREGLIADLVREDARERREYIYRQIEELDRYERSRPVIGKSTWIRFERSNSVPHDRLIAVLDKTLTGLFSVTGGRSNFYGMEFDPFLWVQTKRDATFLKMKGFIKVDGVNEVLKHVKD